MKKTTKDNNKTPLTPAITSGVPAAATLTSLHSRDLTLPVSDDASMERYIKSVQKFPLLSAEEEYKYATDFRATGDKFAAEKLVSSHLRMVVSVAYDFRNYGVPVGDLIASGNLGLVQALQKFDPERGFRFSTYAMFWIRAEIYETILSNWSMAKIGTSANQKRVFFNLARAKRALGIMDSTLSGEQTRDIANYLEVPEADVAKMSTRMRARDVSLNMPAHDDSDAGDILSNLADDDDNPEEKISDMQFRRFGNELLNKHLAELPARDREILVARRLSDPVLTLEQLADKYGISRERVRQIEDRAFMKLKTAMLDDTGDKK